MFKKLCGEMEDILKDPKQTYRDENYKVSSEKQIVRDELQFRHCKKKKKKRRLVNLKTWQQKLQNEVQKERKFKKYILFT